MKHNDLFFEAFLLSREYQHLIKSLQIEMLESFITYLESLKDLEYEDIRFSGKNEYGYNMRFSEYPHLTISLCWNKDSIWAFKDDGYVHPNLAHVDGEKGLELIQRVKNFGIRFLFG
jgi:hypothetical protein